MACLAVFGQFVIAPSTEVTDDHLLLCQFLPHLTTEIPDKISIRLLSIITTLAAISLQYAVSSSSLI